MRPSISLLVALCVIASGCNRRVFEKVEPSCNVTITVDAEVPVARAADILIVIDNSGSMAEEQLELAANFVNLTPGACPIDLNQAIPERFINPSPALYGTGGELERCGFIQLLAAFDNDFRVGVITTDVGPVDFDGVPQRGCLQPDAQGRKLIQRLDLSDPDPDNNDFAARFSTTLTGISTNGSPAERGLDAAALFLDPAARRADGCEGDLELFRRPEEQLVLLFLTDEEDCSHAYGSSALPDEADIAFDNIDRTCTIADGGCTDGVTCSGAGTCNIIDPIRLAAPRCYTDRDELPRTSVFSERILSSDARAKVAVIAGLAAGAEGLDASGCIGVGDNNITDACFSSRGSSNAVAAGSVCGPSFQKSVIFYETGAAQQAEFERVAAGRGCTLSADGDDASGCDVACCQADAAGRYVAFAEKFVADDGQSNAFYDSICKESYLNTMLKLAAFIASVDFVRLAEAPSSPDLIVVEITRDGEDEPERIAAIDPADCADVDGYYYDPDGVQIVFCKDARPRPGDDVKVRAAGVNDDVEGCTLPADAQ